MTCVKMTQLSAQQLLLLIIIVIKIKSDLTVQ